MKAIMVMFDSLNRRMLSPYGNEWIETPNFERLSRKTVKFMNHYVGSMPCMPARRELHTGRYNFLHRSWGPIEPFDDSMPEILKNNGIYSHLISDHQHYWEDGGGTYHTRYNSWEFIRGQEGDPWKGIVNQEVNENLFDHVMNHDYLYNRMRYHDTVNRNYQQKESDFPQAMTFESGIEFIQNNKNEDNWFLHLETFDPHEPFNVPKKYKELYPDEYKGPEADWPPYFYVQEDEEEIVHTKNNYAALVTMCDTYLGKILDLMDENNMWEDTLLIVNTDHGYLLGEHGWWAKSMMPMYNEIAHIPLFIYDPRSKKQNETRDVLTQSVDLTATILDFFKLSKTKDMQSESLLPVIQDNVEIRDYAMFGDHNSMVNITDGQFVYMRGPKNVQNGPSYEYTLMPTHMRERFSIHKELVNAVISDQKFEFSKGAPLLKIPTSAKKEHFVNFGDKLFDVSLDPEQTTELTDVLLELKMTNLLLTAMSDSDAPIEQYERLGLPVRGEITLEQLKESKSQLAQEKKIIDSKYAGLSVDQGVLNMLRTLEKFVNQDNVLFEKVSALSVEEKITDENIKELIFELIKPKDQAMVSYFVLLSKRNY